MSNSLNPVTVGVPHILQGDVNDFINKLPGYDCNEGVISLLDLLRTINESNNYYWLGASFPYGNNVIVNGNQTVSGSLTVPAGSYVTSISCYDDVPDDPHGFKVSIYDKGSRAPIIYGNYALERLVAGNGQLVYGVDVPNRNISGMNADTPFGPAYLQSPFIVTPPGVLNWEIVNLGSAQIYAQVLLCCAVPINAESRNVVIMKKG